MDRSTILHDFRELDQVDKEYQRLMAEQPWVKSELTVTEFAEEIGASPETVRAMVRDGLVKAKKRPGKGRGGRWYVPIEKLIVSEALSRRDETAKTSAHTADSPVDRDSLLVRVATTFSILRRQDS